MLRTLTVALVLNLVGGSIASAATWSMGGLMESRMQKEVNPDYAELKNTGGIFAKVGFWPMAVLLESAREERDSGSGGLKVSSESTSLGVWGRYEFRDPGTWSPFAGIGAGMHFDKVTTTFAGQRDVRSGQRNFMGVGGGITKSFWSHVLVELEARAVTVQQRNDPMLSALFRAGVQF